MLTRRTSRTVTFRRPFILDGFDRVQPAGDYVVETEEEEIGSVYVPAYRHMFSAMILSSEGLREYFPFDPQNLAEALERDSAPPIQQDDYSPAAWRGMDWVRRNQERNPRN
jgi:hypothetical protein